MKSFEHGGVWWDPRDPQKTRVGTLHFDPDEGATLRLIVPPEKPDLFPEMQSYDLLHGVTTDSKAITLVHCIDQSSTGTLVGRTPRPLVVFANEVIVGAHCSSDDPVALRVSATYRHLNEWFGRSGISADHAVKPPDFIAKYTAPPPVVVHDDGRLKISIRSRLTSSVGGHRARMRERIQLEIEAAMPAPLSEFRRLVHACGDLLSVACFALCDTRSVSIEFPPNGQGRKQHGSFHAVPIYKNRSPRKWQGPRMLFRYGEIEDRAPAIFGAWLSQLEQLEAARALYFSGVYGGGFVETKLLALTQGVEAFHRRFHPPGLFMDPVKFEAEVLKPLKDGIPKGIDASFRQSLKDRLKYANEHSLRKRLRGLVNEHFTALTALVENPGKWYSPIVDHRNEFTHYPVASASNAAGARSDYPELVLLYNYILQLLLQACFLRAMGFSADEVAAMTHRCETYRQLSLRFGHLRPPAKNRRIQTVG